MGLQHHYQVMANEIRGANGTHIMYAGLSDMTANALKSFEGVDIVWCEEGQTISRHSWKTLIPTIRKDDSEIWVSYNPQLETDETHQRFTVHAPPDTINVVMNWRDNPWFPKVLDDERRHAQRTLPEWEYLNIWEGICMPAVEGAIYANEMAAAESRIREVPHDPSLPVHAVFDLGFADAMAIIVCQRVSSEIRVIHYIEDTHLALPDYSAMLKSLTFGGKKPNWGKIWLPHDGFAKKHQTGISDATVLSNLGWTVERVPDADVETGIKRVREAFGRVYFDADGAGKLVHALRRYRRKLQANGSLGNPVHDEFSHGADAFRYLCLAAPQMENVSWAPLKQDYAWVT